MALREGNSERKLNKQAPARAQNRASAKQPGNASGYEPANAQTKEPANVTAKQANAFSNNETNAKAGNFYNRPYSTSGKEASGNEYSLSDAMLKKTRKYSRLMFSLSGLALGILAFFFSAFVLFSVIYAFFVPDLSSSLGNPNVAVIPINGIIISGKAPVFEDGYVGSDDIISLIDKADSDDSIKAIVFKINSPGGSPVASDNIGSRILRLNKTSVAVISEIGASGAYWIASSCDYIFSNRMSVVGSIGVIASYLDFSGFLRRYNVSYERLVAGKYKDAGSQFRKLTPEERELFQKRLDMIHEMFIEQVAINRNLSIDNVSAIATGQIFLGEEAVSLGLVDFIGNIDDAYSLIEDKYNISAVPVDYEPDSGFFGLFGSLVSSGFFEVGRGISYGLAGNRLFLNAVV